MVCRSSREDLHQCYCHKPRVSPDALINKCWFEITWAQRKSVLNVCVNETGSKERFFSAQAEKQQHDEPMGVHVILFI